jgi:small subunit ribosomal protein S4
VVNIPSYEVAPGDVVSIRENKRQQLRIQGAMAAAQARPACSWIDIDSADFKGTYKSMPDRSDLPADILEKLIVELYSK